MFLLIIFLLAFISSSLAFGVGFNALITTLGAVGIFALLKLIFSKRGGLFR